VEYQETRRCQRIVPGLHALEWLLVAVHSASIRLVDERGIVVQRVR
jgi:hypothetical protein